MILDKKCYLCKTYLYSTLENSGITCDDQMTEMLYHLQRLHDSLSVDRWEKRLEELAAQFSLNWS